MGLHLQNFISAIQNNKIMNDTPAQSNNKREKGATRWNRNMYECKWRHNYDQKCQAVIRKKQAVLLSVSLYATVKFVLMLYKNPNELPAEFIGD